MNIRKMSVNEVYNYAEELRELNIKYSFRIKRLTEHYQRQLKELSLLKRQVKIKDKWCNLINHIAFDYDGYSDSEHLKNLIDEICLYAKRSIESDDKTIVYENGYSKQNILLEEIKEKEPSK